MLSSAASPLRLIGASSAVRQILEDIDSAARSDAKVLVTGETGVGKEIISKLIHQRSRRKSALLTTVNCAGLTETLLESELFGHVRGSFTGAYRDKPGIFETAANGTVFLDEVGEMSQRMQAVLLRFLETGELQRVGADRVHTRVNVRVLAATNRRLEDEIAAGTFRADLFYRLNVIRIAVPPLRERRQDIPLLIQHFLTSADPHGPVPTLEPAAMDILVANRWPGNIRELKNVVERLVVRKPRGVITVADLPADVRIATDAALTGGRASGAGAGADLVSRMVDGGESFWSAVHHPFMMRDLTRDTLRGVISAGLQRTAGNYRVMTTLFNIPPHDYKRFLSFLRKHDCQVGFRAFRTGDRVRRPIDETAMAACA